MRWWRSVCPVRAAAGERCLRDGAAVDCRVNRRRHVVERRRARHDARGRCRQLMTRVPRRERCRLRGARRVVTIGLCRGSCFMRSRTCPIADQSTDRRAGNRESQQQRDDAHGNYSFTGGRQPQEQLAPAQAPQSQRFVVFDMSTSFGADPLSAFNSITQPARRHYTRCNGAAKAALRHCSGRCEVRNLY